MTVKNVLISACLLGVTCRYDGQAKIYEGIRDLLKEDNIRLIPVCPEQLGGLPTPRHPSEIRGDRVVNDQGEDVTGCFLKGAQETLGLCRIFQTDCAILKEKSPSCGHGEIYDGSFSRRLTQGYGVTAELLTNNGVRIFGESELDQCIRFCNRGREKA